MQDQREGQQKRNLARGWLGGTAWIARVPPQMDDRINEKQQPGNPHYFLAEEEMKKPDGCLEDKGNSMVLCTTKDRTSEISVRDCIRLPGGEQSQNVGL